MWNMHYKEVFLRRHLVSCVRACANIQANSGNKFQAATNIKQLKDTRTAIFKRARKIANSDCWYFRCYAVYVVKSRHATKHRTHIHNGALLATQHHTTRHAATKPTGIVKLIWLLIV